MKIVLSEKDRYILRFDIKEELFKNLTEFCKSEQIDSAFFSAIGSASEVTLSYYSLDSKAYEDHLIKENLEIVSITGNIASLNDLPAIHAHGVLAKKDLSTIGGHIKQLVVSATCELLLTKFDSKLSRQEDEETNLNLLQ